MVDDRTVRFHFNEPFLDFPILLGTGNVCGAGWVVPAKYYETGRPGRVSAEADRRRPLQAGLAGTGREARVRGVRRLLPPGPHQAVDDGQRARGGDPRRDARARRGRHHLFCAGRTDRPGQEQSRSCMLAPVVSGNWWLRVPRLSRTRTTRSTTSGCARRSASPSTATRSTTPNAAGWAWSTATGSTTMSNTACDGRNGQHNIAKAKQLMAEAGHPNGFNVDWVTAVPNYYSRGERIVSQLQAIGIRSQAADDGARRLSEEDAGRAEGMAGRADHLQCHPDRRHLVELVRHACSNAAASTAKDCICVKELDAKFDQVPDLVRPRRTQEAGRGDPADDPGELLFRAGVPPRLRQRDRAAHRGRRNGRTCSRRSPPATPIRGRTSS